MNIAFIPVRGGSKSIPLKNIKELCGKPLVYWCAKAANDAKYVDKVIIATDSLQIKNTVLNFNLEKLEIFDRNQENASDTASTESVMIEYINSAKLSEEDTFILIQATSPLLQSQFIDDMYNKLVSGNADSIFSGVREKQFHWIEVETTENKDYQVKPINYDYKNRPRRQDFRGIIAENGACYMNSVKNIIRDNCRLSGKIITYEMPAWTSYEIDEEDDWLIVENIMQKKRLIT